MPVMASGDEWLATALATLERLREALWGVIEADRYHVDGSGTCVRNPETGELIRDDRPRLRALAELRRVNADISRLRGEYKPRRWDRVTVDTVDAEIRRLADEIRREQDGEDGSC